MNTIDTKAFFDPATYTVTYLVSDKNSKQAVIIDSVLDFATNSGRTSTQSADRIIDYVNSKKLTVSWILESHAHADHLSAAPYLKEKLNSKIAIGENITKVQSTFRDIFNLEAEFSIDGSQFDKLLAEGDTLNIGDTQIEVLHTPGHTPACLSYKIGDSLFVGDTLFMPDFGTARTDFPGGDAATLYRSIKRLLSFPANTKIFVGHDYMAEGRDFYAWESTVAKEIENNIHLKNDASEEDFVNYRTTRDATLDLPELILPAVQVNIRAGEMPPKEDNGVSYLKLPINAL